MNSLFIITLILYVLVIPIETFALALLISLKQNNVRGSQKFILIALCTTELIYAIADITYISLILLRVSDIASKAVLVFNVTTLTFFYILVMTLIAIDRFLEIYLNIKYDILWSPQKTKFTLIGAFAICFLSYIPSLIVELRNPTSLGKALIYYINPTLDLTFFIVASCSYFYITKEVLRHRKTRKQIEKQLEQNNRVVHRKQSKNRFKLLVPTLIILTFLLFVGAPNFIRLFVIRGHIPHFAYYTVHMMVPIGFITDAMIYIFNLNAVRRAIRNMIQQRNYIHPAIFSNFHLVTRCVKR